MNEPVNSTPPTKIGLVFNHGTIVGGGEISFIDLILGLDKKEWLPVVWLPEDGPINKKLKDNGIETRIQPFPPLKESLFLQFVKTIFELKKQFIREEIKLVHINGARAMLYAATAARLAKIPVLWHVRVLERDGWLDKIRAKLASVIIANSQAVERSLIPYKGKKKCYVVYNGIRLEKWMNATTADLQKKFGIQKGVPIILYVGRLSKWKGIEDLILACSKLKKEGIAFQLLLVGQKDNFDPEYANFLKELTVKENILEETIFADWQDDIPSIMKSSSVLVLPSYDESFGRVIIESWASGLPVIATNAGGPAEIIKESYNGLLFEVGDVPDLVKKIIIILKDKMIYTNLQKNGMLSVDQFSLERHIKNICSIYAKVLSEYV